MVRECPSTNFEPRKLFSFSPCYLSAVNIRALFHRLEKLSVSLTADQDMIKKDKHLEEEFIDVVIKLKDEIQGIRRYLEKVMKDRLTVKQLQMLENIRMESNPGMDIRSEYCMKSS